MFTCKKLSLTLASFCAPMFFSTLSYAEEENAVYQWQKERLLSPSEQVKKIETEKKQVFIYEEMNLSDVEKALDEQFSRMEYMMFIQTKLPPTGAGKKPDKEDDGC